MVLQGRHDPAVEAVTSLPVRRGLTSGHRPKHPFRHILVCRISCARQNGGGPSLASEFPRRGSGIPARAVADCASCGGLCSSKPTTGCCVFHTSARPHGKQLPRCGGGCSFGDVRGRSRWHRTLSLQTCSVSGTLFGFSCAMRSVGAPRQARRGGRGSVISTPLNCGAPPIDAPYQPLLSLLVEVCRAVQPRGCVRWPLEPTRANPSLR